MIAVIADTAATGIEGMGATAIVITDAGTRVTGAAVVARAG
ncbi:hypothetical protein EDF43_11433 [Rathayibacter sp. PhB179]|nr:hypothetical protein EDF49_11453 [Rathayibacter sp. PhB192]TCM23746.1 hypothetical protein EDF43_11433 [Rathayibacter sp. PhB179]